MSGHNILKIAVSEPGRYRISASDRLPADQSLRETYANTHLSAQSRGWKSDSA